MQIITGVIVARFPAWRERDLFVVICTMSQKLQHHEWVGCAAFAQIDFDCIVNPGISLKH